MLLTNSMTCSRLCIFDGKEKVALFFLLSRGHMDAQPKLRHWTVARYGFRRLYIHLDVGYCLLSVFVAVVVVVVVANRVSYDFRHHYAYSLLFVPSQHERRRRQQRVPYLMAMSTHAFWSMFVARRLFRALARHQWLLFGTLWYMRVRISRWIKSTCLILRPLASELISWTT